MNEYTQEKYKKRNLGFFGGDERIRTADLPRAKRSLCQLSYTPDLFTLGIANNVKTKSDYNTLMTKQYLFLQYCL